MRQSKERRIAAGEFKTHCLRLMEELQSKRVPIVITKHGKPIAKLVPYTDSEDLPTLFGCLAGTATIHGDIVESTGEQWEADA